MAGALALLRQYLRDGFFPTGVRRPQDMIDSPASSLMRALAIASAVPPPQQTAPSYDQGYGRPDFLGTLRFCDASGAGLARFSAAVEQGDVQLD